jgi:hypothetical protein
MVTLSDKKRPCAGWMMTELLVALAILMGALLPVAYSLSWEKRLARSLYTRALAMELVDGETEVLAAGAWRAYAPGTHPYVVSGRAATNLPPGRFVLTVSENRVRLEWQPSLKRYGGSIVREFAK